MMPKKTLGGESGQIVMEKKWEGWTEESFNMIDKVAK